MKNTNITKYEQRQIDLMKTKIREYKRNLIDLNTLIGDLDSLLDCLSSVTDEWKNVFSRCWASLEIVYACSIEDNKQFLDAKDLVEIQSALNKITNLLNSL